MKKSSAVSLLLASLLLSLAGAHTQVAAQSREMVKMDRNAFLSMFSWSETASNWVLKSGMMPPAGLKTREEVNAMRDEFLSMNVWNEANSDFQPIKGGKPRDMSTLTREQARMEVSMFAMMFRFDEVNGKWIKTMR
jgi:hypothetical protein